MITMAVSACAGAPGDTSNSPERRDGLPSGVVTWVVDGDTVEIEIGPDTITVRLIGINAPDREECFYTEATDHLIETLKGATVGIEGQGLDQFDRTLAYLWHADELVNLRMVAEGLAIATTPDEADPYGALLLAAEQQAFEAAKGLWGRSVCGAAGVPPALELDVSEFDPPGADGDVLAEEAITITNVGEDRVLLGGFVLRDESSRHRLVFPDSAALAPGESMRISSLNDAWEPGGSPVWSNDGDMALLLDSDGRVVGRSRYRS